MNLILKTDADEKKVVTLNIPIVKRWYGADFNDKLLYKFLIKNTGNNIDEVYSIFLRKCKGYPFKNELREKFYDMFQLEHSKYAKDFQIDDNNNIVYKAKIWKSKNVPQYVTTEEEQIEYNRQMVSKVCSPNKNGITRVGELFISHYNCVAEVLNTFNDFIDFSVF